jgi:hypothetical protein
MGLHLVSVRDFAHVWAFNCKASNPLKVLVGLQYGFVVGLSCSLDVGDKPINLGVVVGLIDINVVEISLLVVKIILFFVLDLVIVFAP